MKFLACFSNFHIPRPKAPKFSSLKFSRHQEGKKHGNEDVEAKRNNLQNLHESRTQITEKSKGSLPNRRFSPPKSWRKITNEGVLPLTPKEVRIEEVVTPPITLKEQSQKPSSSSLLNSNAPKTLSSSSSNGNSSIRKKLTQFSNKSRENINAVLADTFDDSQRSALEAFKEVPENVKDLLANLFDGITQSPKFQIMDKEQQKETLRNAAHESLSGSVVDMALEEAIDSSKLPSCDQVTILSDAFEELPRNLYFTNLETRCSALLDLLVDDARMHGANRTVNVTVDLSSDAFRNSAEAEVVNVFKNVKAQDDTTDIKIIDGHKFKSVQCKTGTTFWVSEKFIADFPRSTFIFQDGDKTIRFEKGSNPIDFLELFGDTKEEKQMVMDLTAIANQGLSAFLLNVVQKSTVAVKSFDGRTIIPVKGIGSVFTLTKGTNEEAGMRLGYEIAYHTKEVRLAEDIAKGNLQTFDLEQEGTMSFKGEIRARPESGPIPGPVTIAAKHMNNIKLQTYQ